MKRLLTVLIALFGLSLIAVEADARRMGGGKSIGSQRSMQQQAAPKAPAQQQQGQQAAGTPAQTQPAAAAGSKWLGPLAGLAMGAGLMALFMNNGLAGAFAGLLLMAALVFIGVMVFRALRTRSGATEPMQYAGQTQSGPQAFGGGSAAPHSVAATTTTAGTTTASRWPADFNAEEFVRHARRNFVRLQEAHDARDSAALADFLTPDVLAAVQEQWQAEGANAGKTDVVTLESEVLDVVTEGLLYIVSVRFSGLIREGDAEPQSFAEIWHLEKPLRGSTGWLVSGIQQA